MIRIIAEFDEHNAHAAHYFRHAAWQATHEAHVYQMRVGGYEYADAKAARQCETELRRVFGDSIGLYVER